MANKMIKKWTERHLKYGKLSVGNITKSIIITQHPVDLERVYVPQVDFECSTGMVRTMRVTIQGMYNTTRKAANTDLERLQGVVDMYTTLAQMENERRENHEQDGR